MLRCEMDKNSENSKTEVPERVEHESKERTKKEPYLLFLSFFGFRRTNVNQNIKTTLN